MIFKHYIALVEAEQWPEKHLWIACSKENARRIIQSGPTPEDKFADSPEGAKNVYEDVYDEVQPIILEFEAHKKIDIEDIKDKAGDGITVHNPKALIFKCVWEGVVEDAFAEEINPKLNHLDQMGELDEVAIGGLKRCTAVTANALLKHYRKRPITLNDVPETDVGVLEILSKGGLVYKPAVGSAGRTVQQFANLNRRGAWYIVTPGHAMALINNSLFDAENRGTDGRKIIQAYQIGKR